MSAIIVRFHGPIGSKPGTTVVDETFMQTLKSDLLHHSKPVTELHEGSEGWKQLFENKTPSLLDRAALLPHMKSLGINKGEFVAVDRDKYGALGIIKLDNADTSFNSVSMTNNQDHMFEIALTNNPRRPECKILSKHPSVMDAMVELAKLTI